VTDLERSTAFYTTLFATEPTVVKDDYRKWLLEDPAVNFAISNRAGRDGVDHLGLQVDSDEEVEAIEARLAAADERVAPQRNAACCYASGNKSWARDPAGVPWETFHTMANIETFGSDHAPIDAVDAPAASACCAEPAVVDEKAAAPKTAGVCCG